MIAPNIVLKKSRFSVILKYLTIDIPLVMIKMIYSTYSKSVAPSNKKTFHFQEKCVTNVYVNMVFVTVLTIVYVILVGVVNYVTKNVQKDITGKTVNRSYQVLD